MAVAIGLVAIMIAGLLLRANAPGSIGPLPPRTPVVGRTQGVDLRIIGSAPGTWDPAIQGDAATAQTLAQVFEGLTVFDSESRVQPALARSWSVEDGGKRMVFTLREGLRFSDGRPLGPADVVSSWLRLLDPARPSPLSSLLTDVRGASEYLRGTGSRDAVGLRADGDRVVVEFRRAASYFLGATASPSLAVVAPDMGDAYRGPVPPTTFVASGGYMPVSETPTVITLKANPSYWAGEPPLKTIEIVTDTAGQSPTQQFISGDLDVVDLSGSADWSWIRYDPTLGPQLRRSEIFSVLYYGFDTTKPPFDDARVRRAFAAAVDWDRLVRVGNPSSAVATSLVPPGIPAAGDADYTPAYDPDGARAALAEAGYGEGKPFPEVTLRSNGGFDTAVARELTAVLGVTVRVEIMDATPYFDRLRTDPPAFWTLDWIADYPAPHDFLGLLLETGSSNNYGNWSNAEFDAALETAAATADPVAQARAYDAAQRILQREVPVIPVSLEERWSLTRTGLLGAATSGLGLQRYAGMQWAPGQ